jgi:serine/threonine-protein kinase
VTPPVAAGTLVGRYLVQEYLGQGSLGTAFRAFERDHGSVVIKVLTGLAGFETRLRFRDLAPKLVRVRHPGLISVLCHGERAGVPYLVEDYVPTITLAERLRRASMPATGALGVLRGLARALDLAHESGMVHGSLRPAQILLLRDDRPLITDLGLAALLAAGRDRPSSAWQAPEVTAGDRPGPPADVYALAAIAYQLLVDASPPFPDSDVLLKPPSTVRRTLPTAVDQVLLRGLARAPEMRWPSVGALVDALVGVFNLEPAVELVRPVRSRRLLPLTAAVCTAVIVVGTALVGQIWQPPRPVVRTLRATMLIGSPGPATAPVVRAPLGGGTEAVTSPDPR